MPVVEDFRITEGLDSRITELGDSRVIEYGYSSATLDITSSLAITVKLLKAARTNLNTNSTLSSTYTFTPFTSSLYAKDGITWKTAVSYVKYNGIWVSPIFAAIKVNGIWKRVL